MSVASFIDRARGQVPLAKDAGELDRWIDEQARAGFPNEQERICDCRRVLDYYELRGRDHFRRRADESPEDFECRPRISLPLTQRVVSIICRHLYMPGPSRKLKAGDDEWLQQVYRDNLMNSLMQEADALSTLLGIAAIQAADTGDDNMQVKLQLWGYDQLILYPDVTDGTVIAHVITIDRVDERTRYTWYSVDQIRTYMTKKLAKGQTTGGRVAELVLEATIDNPYGALPFWFVHYKLPTRDYKVPGIGFYLADVNAEIDVAISNLFEGVEAYQLPEGYAYNTDANWQPSRRVGELTKVTGVVNEVNGHTDPRIEYLQAEVNIPDGWDHVQRAIDTVLEGLGVPQTAYRMNESTLPSGAAQVAEQQPLLDAAEMRQEPFRKYEADGAKVILMVGGKAPPDSGVDLTCRWPVDLIRTPGPEQDVQDQASLQMDMESEVMVAKRRFKFQSDEEAWEHLQKVAEDKKRIRQLGLGPQAAMDQQMEMQQQSDALDQERQMALSDEKQTASRSASGAGESGQ